MWIGPESNPPLGLIMNRAWRRNTDSALRPTPPATATPSNLT